MLLVGPSALGLTDLSRHRPLQAFVEPSTLDRLARPANQEDEPSIIQKLNQRFHSDDGVTLTVLENENMYMFHSVAVGSVSVSEPSTAASLLHSALMRPKYDARNASLISASVLRHDLPVEVAEDLGRVGLVITPLEKGCAFPNDAQSMQAPMKQWMQMCLPRCTNRSESSGGGSSWQIEPPQHAGCLDATVDPELWSDED
eukprot:3760522-Prymnesium_polylepis.4